MDVVAVVSALAALVPSSLDEGSVAARLADVGRLRGWLDGVEAGMVHRLDQLRRARSAVCAPGLPVGTLGAGGSSGVRGTDDEVAAAQRVSRQSAQRARRRGGVLDEVPALATVLARGEATGEHADAVSGALSGLPTEIRRSVVGRHGAQIAEWAARLDPAAVSAEVRALGDRIAGDAGVSRRQRQRQDVRMRTWIDRHTQMVHFSGRYDPALGVRLQQRLDRCVETRFHDRVPDDCPQDPGERQDFLRAHAYAHLALQPGSAGSGGGEIVVIVDAATVVTGEEHDETWIDVPGDVDPTERLARSLGRPQRLDLGRRARLASHAQRIALRVMHRAARWTRARSGSSTPRRTMSRGGTATAARPISPTSHVARTSLA